MQKPKITIIKVPKSEEISNAVKSKKDFPRMPRMYLELIENKDKIKSNMVNKEYDPDEASTVMTMDQQYQKEILENSIVPDTVEASVLSVANTDKHDMSSSYAIEQQRIPPSSDVISVHPPDEEDIIEEEEEDDSSSTSEENDNPKEEKEIDEEKHSRLSSVPESSRWNDEEDDREYEDNDFGNRSIRNDLSNIKKEDDSILPDAKEDDYAPTKSEPMLQISSYSSSSFSNNQNIQDSVINKHNNMKSSIIGEDVRSQVVVEQPQYRPVIQPSPPPPNKTSKEELKDILKRPPKLSDLEKKGFVKTHKVIPQLETNDSIEEEDELKRELLYKFDLLKRSYKNVEIPSFTIHSDYKSMNKTYENTLRRVSLDTNVDNYKNYMIAGFMLIEYILSAWFKFDMNGFTQQQIINMNQYERLLIELGEKSYVPLDKQWPVELRLLGMILLNAVIFIVARIIIKKTGTNLFGMMNAPNMGSSNSTTSNPSPEKKRKMKGPSIDLDSILD